MIFVHMCWVKVTQRISAMTITIRRSMNAASLWRRTQSAVRKGDGNERGVAPYRRLRVGKPSEPTPKLAKGCLHVTKTEFKVQFRRLILG